MPHGIRWGAKDLAESPFDGTVSVRTVLEARSGGQTRDVIMRQQICILLTVALAALSATSAGAVEQPPKPGSCPYAIKPLPRNVTRATDRIIKDMYPELKVKLIETKCEDLVQFQTDWGAGIRRSLCLVAGGNDQL